MMGPRKGFFKRVFKITLLFLYLLTMAGEDVIAGTKGGGIKVSDHNYRDVTRKTQ